jgi:hypothetical protein
MRCHSVARGLNARSFTVCRICGLLTGVDPQPLHRRLLGGRLPGVPGLAGLLAFLGLGDGVPVLLADPPGAQLGDPADDAGVVGGQGPQDTPDGAERAGLDLVVGLGDLGRVGVRRGLRCGRLERSLMPASPKAR